MSRRTHASPTSGSCSGAFFHPAILPSCHPAIPSCNPAILQCLYPDYVRVARFLYKKEFQSAGSSSDDVAQVARLYQSRPHSTDTQIEAGFGVYLGLGTLHELEPALRVTRVLIIGPGLDLAPRTDLMDLVGPQSHQPFA